MLVLNRRLLALLLVAIAWPGQAEPAIAEPVGLADYAYDHWYLDTIDGKPSGYWHAWLAVEDDRIVSGYEELRVEKHDGEKLESRTRVVWTESLAFKPITILVEESSGSAKVSKTYRFTETGIELTSEQDGRTIKRTLPKIESHYLSSGLQTVALQHSLRKVRKKNESLQSQLRETRGKAPNRFSYNTLDPLVGMKPYVTRYRESSEQFEPFELADGSKVEVTPWIVTYSVLPGFEQQAYIDKQGREVGFAYKIGGMRKVSRLADESVRKTEFDPPEMAGLSVVVPDKPIENLKQQRRITYELTYQAGDAEILPVNTTHQRVEKLGDDRVLITVDLDATPAADSKDKPTDANLASSIRVDHKDTAVVALTDKATRDLGADATQQQIANACRRMVGKHLAGITLAVGDATASEAARTGKGDCTECSVLLAAMLRARGIPSRCVTGLAYSEDAFAGKRDAFVYHMWTQAWIQDEDGSAGWVDLDAALWRFSAGHIALGVSDMGDNDQADLVRIVPMMQGLEIKVIQKQNPE